MLDADTNTSQVDQLVRNDVSSTKVRMFLRKGMSVEYLIPGAFFVLSLSLSLSLPLFSPFALERLLVPPAPSLLLFPRSCLTTLRQQAS